MRLSTFLAAGLIGMLAACATQTPPPPPPQTFSQNWVLLAPPDDPLVLALLDNIERLPGPGDELSRTAVPGLTTARYRSLQRLFDEAKQLPSADQRGRYLVERAVLDTRPVHEWREVRRFSTGEKCETTLRQLQANTTEMDQKMAYRTGMYLDQLEWKVMARSFGQGRCIFDIG